MEREISYKGKRGSVSHQSIASRKSKKSEDLVNVASQNRLDQQSDSSPSPPLSQNQRTIEQRGGSIMVVKRDFSGKKFSITKTFHH